MSLSNEGLIHSHQQPAGGIEMDSRLMSPELVEIAAKVLEGQRLNLEEGITLYKTPDLHTVGRLANWVRENPYQITDPLGFSNNSTTQEL